MLFQPMLMSDGELECKSVPEAVWGAIQAVEVDTRVDLGKNILLSGGNSMFAGFADRLKAEIVKLAPEASDIRVTASKDRKNAVWVGTSGMASLSTFAAQMITKQDFEETGARAAIAKKNPS